MSYREKTPQIISILTRKLKPGKTVEDFQKAHLPPGNAKETEFGYDVDYFHAPTRVIHAVSVADPSVIISIGLTYGNPEVVLQEVHDKLPLEQERANKIAQVADKVGPSMIYFVASDNNYGGADETQLPLYEVTSEVVAAIESLIPQKKNKNE
ncbi:hypothetical protein [Legionella oakridgensis]|uniref:Uncharacterized protein n=1 Tax=Legionella oakridgensis TaxID=29423 RepID=A0A0W0XJ32_9GAMM|nr:hypothetical protein [Legionella oakridgensis]ETO92491.1 hypothetical protein LOR_9c01000 [Legionella oakridgensis RV-2-2007]KTD44599.1 hypothetical protein Loak_0110 [Legionella oakridgensis]STY20989.1 Uncharacterised protein [Legionella longbeachae]